MSFSIEEIVEGIMATILVDVLRKGAIRLFPLLKAQVKHLKTRVKWSPAILISFTCFPAISTGFLFLIEPLGFWNAMIFAPLLFLLGVMLAQLNVIASKI